MAEIGDVVELITDIPSRGLRAGTRGTIVHRHSNQAYEVEFTNEEGETLDFSAVRSEQLIVVWRVETGEWVSIAEQAAALVANLPNEAGREVLDFARFLLGRTQLTNQDKVIEKLSPV